MTLESFREYFEPIYKKEIESLLLKFSSYSPNKEIQKLINKTIDLSGGGKRIRAYVCALSYEAKNTKELSKIKNQLIAIELLHFFALIHDDLMDNSTLRHGKKTINSYGKTEKEILKSKNESIIMGDLIFAYSYKLFLRKNNSPKSIEIFEQLIEEVIFGQTLDLELSQNIQHLENEVLNKMLYKTARYTFTHPIQIGLILKNEKIESNLLKKSEKFGDALGMIFQIDDDLLDIFGDTKELNKNTFQDIEASQATILTSLAFKNKKFKKLLVPYFGIMPSSESKENIKKIFIDSGAKEKSLVLKEKYIDIANKNTIGSPKFSIIWKNLLVKISNRTK